ncbi:CpaE family protein [Pedococcus sp. NPDC057267]|uniref:AAA family ATPase n=1 Tax=Pedococcus sp. NPDC057267 TaxID=3346077 RepID=UPI0036447321
MTRSVLTALTGAWEPDVVTALEATSGYAVARRCADLADLLATAAAGLGDLALVSAELRALDRPALHELAEHGLGVAGVVAPGDEAGERRLRQLGLAVVVAADVSTPDLEDALDEAASGSLGAAGAGVDEPVVEDPVQLPGGRPGRVLAVWGPTGAPGRSTVALNLAAELAVHAPTLLVDADTYGSSLAQALGLLDEAPGMTAACRAADQGGLDLVALARLAPEVSPGLRVLTGTPRPHRWTELRAPSVAQVLGIARQLASHVVVDCGFCVEDDEELSYDTLAPRRNAATLTALEEADDLVVVGAADPIGLQRLVRSVQDLATVPSPSPTVVVNKVRASAVGSRPERRIAEALQRFAGMDDLTYLPWDQATLDAAMFAGTTLADHAPQSDLRRAVQALAARWAGGGAVVSRRSRRAARR